MDSIQLTKSKEIKLIAVISAFLSIIFLDQTGVGVILASVQREMHLSSMTISWVMNAYLIALTLFLLFFARLSERFGMKNIFCTGIAIFLLASIGCAMARSGAILILSRVLQGVGASMGYATYLLLLSRQIPLQRRGKALGTSAAFAAVALALGPLLGGFFSSVISWRYLFWLNVPICLLCLYYAYTTCENTEIAKDYTIDLPGLIFYICAIISCIFVLMEGSELGWSNTIIVAMIPLSVFFFVVFFVYEKNASSPLLDISLFKNKIFVVSVIILFSNYACVTSIVFWALWMQYVLKFSALKTGIALLPAGVPYIFSSKVGGKLYDKKGARTPLLIGSIIFFIGFLEMTLVSLSNNYFLFMIGMFLFGIGWGLVRPCAILSALNSVTSEHRSMATGLISTFRQFGAAFGFALVHAVISTIIIESLRQIIKNNLLHISTWQLNYNFIHTTASQSLITPSLFRVVSAAHNHGFFAGLLVISLFTVLNIALVFKYIPKCSVNTHTAV